MSTSFIGYEFLKRHYSPYALNKRPAMVMPVLRITALKDALHVPRSVSPLTDDPLEHVLFALKHEGTNLLILSDALPRIGASTMEHAFEKIPSGAYIRKACFLWEVFTGNQLKTTPVTGAMVDIFDSERYVTRQNGERNLKWRTCFNGLGTPLYSPVVERTPLIDDGMRSSVLEDARLFLSKIPKELINRALAWAYLSETESSYAIENENPPHSKMEAFVSLLHQAHDKLPLTEDYLSSLQSTVITNPLERAACFRWEQNWLKNAVRGSAGVTYVPPPPDVIRSLMDAFMDFANTIPTQIHPVVAASLISFGFVFAHPFMDGNGRLSRFLFHHALCRSGEIENGLVLPISSAMKRHESDYLTALQSFSLQARKSWDVQWMDEDNYAFEFKSTDAIYRYWDATSCVEFGLRMAEESLNVDVMHEVNYLRQFDHLYQKVNDSFDIRNNDLNILVRSCLENNGHLSKNRRKQFALKVPAEVFDYMESEAHSMLFENAMENKEDASSGFSM